MPINRQFLINNLCWGFVLWLIGYVLGIVFFFFLPSEILGWVISPIGIVITLWVLFKKIDLPKLSHYLVVSFSWTLIAIVCDYFFLVTLFNPEDGYYKPDVYFYYLTTFLLPLGVGFYKLKKNQPISE